MYNLFLIKVENLDTVIRELSPSVDGVFIERLEKEMDCKTVQTWVFHIDRIVIDGAVFFQTFDDYAILLSVALIH